MHDIFEQRVRSAAVALWWVAAFAMGLLLLSWAAYLLLLPRQPTWLLALWGPGLEWSFVTMVWFWALVVFKIIAWLLIFAALWLTLWARQLRGTL